MKTILFVATSMNVGGVEKALSGVLNALDPTEWDIYLDLIIPEGGFMPTLPPHIKTGCIEELNREYAFCQHPVQPLSAPGFVRYGVKLLPQCLVSRLRKAHWPGQRVDIQPRAPA